MHFLQQPAKPSLLYLSLYKSLSCFHLLHLRQNFCLIPPTTRWRSSYLRFFLPVFLFCCLFLREYFLVHFLHAHCNPSLVPRFLLKSSSLFHSLQLPHSFCLTPHVVRWRFSYRMIPFSFLFCSRAQRERLFVQSLQYKYNPSLDGRLL